MKYRTDNIQILPILGSTLHQILIQFTHGCTPSKQAFVRGALMPRVSHTLSHDLLVTKSFHAVSQAVLPSYQASVSANPYITTTSNDPSDLFAASTIQWPYCQGINQDPPAVYAPTYAPWQSSYNTNDGITGTLTATPQRLDPSTPSQSYAPQRQADTNLQAAVGSAGALGFSLGSHLQNMRDYPSPHSNVSEQTTSSCLSVVSGAMMSPGRPMVPSPSIVRSLGGSESSRQSSRRSTEPPRNVQGVLYCSHPDCANKPSVFSRKCEWT